MKVKLRVLLILIIGSIFCNEIFSQTKLKLVRNSGPEDISSYILKEIYSRINIEIDIYDLPAERARVKTSSGDFDGEVMRVSQYGANNVNIIQVPTPFYSIDMGVFTKVPSNITISSIEDLKGYQVVIIRGLKITSELTEGMDNILVVGRVDQMMKMVNSGRADIGLYSSIAGKAEIKSLKMKDIEMVSILSTFYLYHYLHVKNKDLVEKVDNQIKIMQESGDLKIIREMAENNYLNKIE